MAEDKKAAKASSEAAPKEKKTAAKVAEKGHKVSVEYVGSLEDGKVFDTSERTGKPIQFELGSGHVIPGFDKAIDGMKVGEEKTIKLEPKDAYGDVRKELEKIITRENLPKDHEPQVGMVLLMGLSNGAQIPARITKVNGDMITIDLNHPLAGKTLNFKLKLVGLE